ncbi:hypothetical protein [Levilactobacillus sp. HBUAS70063]|uniref:hypothetical protein n=1 Tax=Levilactobacillus sp. HBUAS70063 TaxID=3109359 RepID=UPI003132B41C
MKQQIKHRVPALMGGKSEVQVLKRHFDGHNGNHLLAYYDDEAVTYLLKIGTHSDLFG